MSETIGPGAGDRLERALLVFLAAPPEARADEVLAAHPDLAELLAPMFAERTSGTSDDSATEQVLGDFRLVRELGRGGMGIVHEAWQRSLDRRVAVKLLAPALVASPAAVARFRREAAAVGKLHHPHIVEVYGFGTEREQHFFAMQLVDGQPLHEVAARFREPRAAVALCLQLAEALAHAHAHGVVHRDVKPANVLVRTDDHALLTDFGVAHDEALPSVTREGGFLGTLDYASPEQVRGEAVDARTDVWALGVILFELLDGHAPFMAPTQEALLHNILVAEPARLVGRPGVSRDLAAVVDRALAKDRQRRYATAAALGNDLRAVLAGEPVQARLPTSFERLRRWTTREPWRAVAALVLLLGLPSAAAGIAFTVAQAPLVALGEQRTAELMRQRLLADVWLSFDVADGSEALKLLPTDPRQLDEELAVMRLLMLPLPLRAAQMDAFAAFRGPAVELMRRALTLPGQIQEPTTDDPLEWFAAGVLQLWLVRSTADHDETEPYRPVVAKLQRAALLASTPQAHVLIVLASAAARAGDTDTLAATHSAMQRHFADIPNVADRLMESSAYGSGPASREYFELQAAQPGPSQARALFNVAVLREQGGDLPGAEAALRHAMALRPYEGRLHTRLGRLLVKTGRGEDGLAMLRRAVEVEPTYVRGWNSLGSALCERGEFAAAETALRRAIALVPVYARAQYNLGYALDGRGAVAEAIDHYRRALTLQPDYAKAQINLASALWRTKQDEQAYAEAVRAMAMAPDHPLAAKLLAEISAQLRRTEHLEAAARNWVRIEPASGKAWHRLAMTLLPSKKPHDVRETLAAAERAVELTPDAAQFRLLLANARTRSGDRTGALKALDAVDLTQLEENERTYAQELRRNLTR